MTTKPFFEDRRSLNPGNNTLYCALNEVSAHFFAHAQFAFLFLKIKYKSATLRLVNVLGPKSEKQRLNKVAI